MKEDKVLANTWTMIKFWNYNNSYNKISKEAFYNKLTSK